MKVAIRGCARSTLAAGAMLAIVLVPSAARSATTTTATTWVPTTIVNHVFTRTFELDDGALTISPFHGVAAKLSPALETTMWATYPLGGQIVGIGFGVVTVDARHTTNNQRPRVTSLVRAPAFIGLTDAADLGFMCPEMRGPGSRVVPVSHGWEAVIFPLDPTRSDAVFTASSNICGQVRPNAIATAYLVLSVRWHLSASGTHIVVSVPACATIYGWGGGGTIYQGTMSFSATVPLLARPLAHAPPPATNFDAGTSYASPSTTHGPTGPIVQVRPATPT